MASFTDQISQFNPYIPQLPVDAMVIYVITLVVPPESLPPPNNPRVLEEQLAKTVVVSVRSPKSVALPAVVMVIYAITLVLILLTTLPPPNTPRVLDAQAAKLATV